MKSHELTVPAINLYFNHVQCGCVHSSMHSLHRVTFLFLFVHVLLHWGVAPTCVWTAVWSPPLHFCCRPDRRRPNQAGSWSRSGPPGCRGGFRPGVLGLHEEIQVCNQPRSIIVTFIYKLFVFSFLHLCKNVTGVIFRKAWRLPDKLLEYY